MEVMERERERARERMLVLVKRKKIAMELAAALAAEDRSIFEKHVACQLLRIENGIWHMSRRLDKCKHELAIVDPPSSSSHYLYSITPPPLEAAPNPSLYLRNPLHLHLCPPNTPFARAPFTVCSSRRHAGANSSNSISSSRRESGCVTVACEIPVTAKSESCVSTAHTNVICEGPENVKIPESEESEDSDSSSGISEEEAAARVVEEEQEEEEEEAAAEEVSEEAAAREVEVVEEVEEVEEEEEEAAAPQAFAQLLHSLCSVRIASPARGLETMTSSRSRPSSVSRRGSPMSRRISVGWGHTQFKRPVVETPISPLAPILPLPEYMAVSRTCGWIVSGLK